MNKVVLDASALIAYIRKEPGAENIIDLLPYTIMSAVNYAEVATVLSKLDMTSEIIGNTLKNFISNIIPFDQSQALVTGILQRQTKTKGLSLGDRACIALGIHLQVPIYTADKIWAELELDRADIRLIC
jgi:PIN domain nuclease of toxin-antitoxin system